MHECGLFKGYMERTMSLTQYSSYSSYFKFVIANFCTLLNAQKVANPYRIGRVYISNETSIDGNALTLFSRF